MVLGVTAGVVQRNVRRMLAYSSIAHAGYLLMAMTSGNDLGKGAVLFYLLTYALTSLGAFGVAALVATRDRPNDDLADYVGLGRRQPMLAFLMTVFLLSLGGFPPTAGFVGKWYLFTSAISAGNYGLAIIGITIIIKLLFWPLTQTSTRSMKRMAGRSRSTATASTMIASRSCSATRLR